MFMALSALLIVRRSYVQSGIVLACIPLIYVSTGPAIGVSAGVLGLYLLISRRCTLVQVAQFMLPLLLTIGYFVVFYATRSSPPEIMEPGGKLADELVPDFGEAHTLLNLFIGTLTLYGLFLGFPLLACAVVFSRKAWQQKRDTLLPLLVWAGTCILMAAVGSTLASHFIDAFQFSSNVIGALLPTLLAVLVGAAFLKTTVWRRVVAIMLLAIGAFVNYSALFSQHKLEMLGSTTYSAQFLREVQKALPDNEVRGGFLFDDKDYESAYMLSEDTYSAGTYLAGMTNHYDLMSLSIFSVDSLSTDPRYRRDSVQARERLHNASIYRYARLEAPASHLSIDSLQYKFVKRYNLAFICASAKAVLPDMLRPLVAKEIVDPRSGEKFYVLNK